MGSACPPLLGPHGPCLVDMCGQRLTSGWQTLESRTPLRESGVWPPGHRAQGPPVGKLSLQQLCSAAGGTHRLKQIKGQHSGGARKPVDNPLTFAFPRSHLCTGHLGESQGEGTAGAVRRIPPSPWVSCCSRAAARSFCRGLTLSPPSLRPFPSQAGPSSPSRHRPLPSPQHKSQCTHSRVQETLFIL